MTSTYLTWVKNLGAVFAARSDAVNLTSSSVAEPSALLAEDIARVCGGDLSERLRVSNAWGHPALIAAIAERSGVQPERVLLTPGASSALYLVCRALLAPGDEVLIEAPGYEPFTAICASLGARVGSFTRGDGGAVDRDALAAMIGPATRLIMLSNLHNPTSALLGDEALLELAALARERGAVLLVDEIFHDFVADRQGSAALLDDAICVVSSLSKVYGLTTLRCGWVLAAPALIERVRQVQEVVENIGSQLTETIASAVFDRLQRYAADAHSLVASNRALARTILGPHVGGRLSGDIPQHGCIYFPRVAGVEDAAPLLERLAARGVFVAPGAFFGAPAHMRIGLGGPPEALERGLTILAREL